MLNIRLQIASLAVAGLMTLAGCDHLNEPERGALPSAVFFTLTDNNQLVRNNVQTLANPGAPVAITGLQPGEQLLDIDFRPANNLLYGVGSSSRVYEINPMTGVATAKGAGPFSPALVAGASVAIDFNPTVDRLRLVGSTGQNLRLNVDTGVVVATDTPINGVAGAMVSDVAYINNVPTATTTILYDIDPASGFFYQQVPPNAGTLTMPFNNGLRFTTTNGFDVSPSGQALAGLTIRGVVELTLVTLSTGRTQKLGNLPANTLSLAIPTN